MGIIRCKYYSAWKLSQSNLVLCGLAYNGEKNKETGEIVHKFDKMGNYNVRQVELNLNVKTKLQWWNRTVHLWLKYNVYLRIVNIDHPKFKNNHSLASLITFMVSAFWHGFYPIYYIFFFQIFILEQVFGMMEKINLFDTLEKSNPLIKFAFWFYGMNNCDSMGIVFALVSLKNGLQFLLNVYFLPLIIIAGSYFVMKEVIKRKHRQDRLKNKETAGKEQ